MSRYESGVESDIPTDLPKASSSSLDLDGFGEEEGMSTEQFREYGKEMVDFICHYADDVNSHPVHPFVMPGFLLKQLPTDPPEDGEDWAEIMKDVEEKIIPGVTHWTHQGFNACLPSCRSFPSLMGDTLSSAIGCNGMTWKSCPAYTELEVVVLDWFGKAIGLPPQFLHCTGEKQGGGCFQPSGSDAVLVSMLAARYQRTKVRPRRRRTSAKRPIDDIDEAVDTMRLLTAYCSTEAHSCVEKAARLCMVQLRVVDTDCNHRLSGTTLQQAIEYDYRRGFIPFWVVATIGTYPTCASDNLEEISDVCKRYPTIWLHVDAAYGGNVLLCPEMRYLSKGIEHADCVNVCPAKWALVNSDCTCFWTRDYQTLIEGLVINPTYLVADEQSNEIDFRHWGVPLSRRFRALKLWLTLRSYGLYALQTHIRIHCFLAERFRSFISSDRHLKLMNEVELGVVCFRVLRVGDLQHLSPDQLTELLLALINATRRSLMLPVRIDGHLCIRFCVTAEHTTYEDIDRASKVVKRCLEKMESMEDISRASRLTSLSSPMSSHIWQAGAQQHSVSCSHSHSHGSSSVSQKQLRALRYLTNTVTVPQEQLHQLPRLQDGATPYVLPDTDDNIVDLVDLSELLLSLNI